MTRAHFYRPLTDNAGNLILDASVRVLQPNTEDLILEPMYADDASATLLGNPLLPTDGIISFYLDEPKVVRLGISRSGQAEQFVDNILVSAVPMVEETFAFGQQGQIAVSTGALRYYVPVDCTITEVRASLGVAPVGAAAIVDVNVNGTTIYTTQANRPTIPDGGYTVVATLPDTTTLHAGDYLTLDVDQVGSTTAGTGLTVQIRVTHPA